MQLAPFTSMLTYSSCSMLARPPQAVERWLHLIVLTTIPLKLSGTSCSGSRTRGRSRARSSPKKSRGSRTSTLAPGLRESGLWGAPAYFPIPSIDGKATTALLRDPGTHGSRSCQQLLHRSSRRRCTHKHDWPHQSNPRSIASGNRDAARWSWNHRIGTCPSRCLPEHGK